MKPRLIVVVGTGILLAWLFAPALNGRSGFAFRDAAHYYRPLFEYIGQEWRAGRPPLWNPYENIGVPLAAENTSSLFYPGKLLFALPLDDSRLYHGYIVLHVGLAAAGGYALARHLGAGFLGAGLGAVSYACGGSVLFQYCNVVFLVGAAWLPLAMLAADRMLRRRCALWAVGLGAALAMMVLGGDPQMAYNAALLVALNGLMLWREERRAGPAASGVKRGLAQFRPALLAAALVVGGLLAAVQIVPTLEAAPYSERAQYDAPRNLYELASSMSTSEQAGELAWYDGLLGRGSGGHAQHVYQFSVAPWRAVELVWPNVAGRAFPTNRRWLDTLLPPGDLWTPTLYLGLLPLVMAVAAWSVRRNAPLDVRFYSWMAVIGGLASLGVYGIAWCASPACGGADLGVGDEVGGLYWWLTVLLPKYVYFRYPAKWFVVASLGLSMLAARGWEATWQSGDARVRRWLAVLAVLSLAGLGATVLGFGYVEAQGHQAAPDPILGPLDWSGARWDVIAALAQTAALALVFLAALAIGDKWPQWTATARVAAFGVTLVDLAMAQGYLVLYAPAEIWRTRPQVLGVLPPDAAEYRVFRELGPRPPSWTKSFSPQRYSDCVRWDRATLWPKYNLPYRVGLLEASQTIVSADYRAVLEVARTHARDRGGGLPDASILDLLAARAAIVGTDAGGEIASPRNVAEGMVVGTRPHALERAWIVHRVETLPELATRAPRRLRAFTERVLFPDGTRRDWRETAVVETGGPIVLDDSGGEDEHCTIVRADPSRVEIEAALAAPGLVVLADLYYPGWELTVETGGRERRVPILRTNRVMRGAILPRGTHRLVYRYRPKSVAYGGAASAIAWMGLALFGLMIAARRSVRARRAGEGVL